MLHPYQPSSAYGPPQPRAVPHARQRLLHPTQGHGLPVRDHLRVLHFLPDRIEFRPTLLAQREDACVKGQVRRAQIYDNLITGLDGHEAS